MRNPTNLLMIKHWGLTLKRLLSSENKGVGGDFVSYTRFLGFLKVKLQPAKLRISPFHPLYPIFSPPTWWMNWPIIEFHVSKLNWWQFSPVIISTYIIQYPYNPAHNDKVNNFGFTQFNFKVGDLNLIS